MGYGKIATIVLDTSAVIAAMELIEQLYKLAPPYNVDLLLPITTLKELDRIKDREKFSSLGIRAREAINWINKTLTTEDVDEPVLRGQRQVEALTPGLEADDSILDCCMYNAVHMRNLTILMSDDHNLRSRALAERLETLDTKGMSAGQILEAIRERTVGFMELDEPGDGIGIPRVDNTANLEPKNVTGFVTEPDNIAQSTIMDDALRNSTPETGPNSLDNQDFGDAEMIEDDDEVPAERSNGGGLATSRWNATKNQRHTKATEQRRTHHQKTSKTINREMIRPIYAEGVIQTLEQNLAALADWHLRREHSPEDLEMLGYKGPPTNLKATFNLIKQYYVPVFRYIVTRTTFDRVAAAPQMNSQASIAAWKQLLLELARNDPEYVGLVANLRE